MKFTSAGAAALAAVVAMGCAGSRPPLCGTPGTVQPAHVVLLDPRGALLDPETGRVFPPEEEKRYIESIVAAASGSNATELLLFFHGGLNSHESTLSRARYLTDVIRGTGAFPIFIGWNSTLVSSYREHVLYLRQGRRRPILGPLTAPLTFVSDTTRGLIRLLPVWLTWSHSALQNTAISDDTYNRTQPARDVLAERYELCLWGRGDELAPVSALAECNEIAFANSCFRVLDHERKASAYAFAATYPTKLLASPIIDAYGGAAWKVMKRRIDALFDPTMDAAPKTDVDVTAFGEFDARYTRQDRRGLPAVLDALQSLVKGPRNRRVALVGHSMGTIILNHVLQRYSEMPVDRIVYLAAACSVAEYEAVILPYLTAHPETDMYHLLLDRQAEVRDGSFKMRDLALRGSLLMWIDDFLEDPDSPKDFTAGREVNLLPAAVEVPIPVRRQIHIQVFGVGNSYRGIEPQTHGDFGFLSFWRSDCLWAPPSEFRARGCYCHPEFQKPEAMAPCGDRGESPKPKP